MPRISTTPLPIYSLLDGKVSRKIECVICLGTFDCKISACYGTKSCLHSVCYVCMNIYMNQVLKSNQYKSYDIICCPGEGCKETFKTAQILSEVFVSKSEIEKWWNTAISSSAYIKNKIDCPIQGCGAVFDVDDELKKKCVFTECVACRKGICVTCQSPWHPGVKKVFDNKDALRKALDMAKKSSWSRCPGCRNIVEKQGGCSEIYCRCGVLFCYNCGIEIHASKNYSCDCWNKKKLDKRRQEMFQYAEKDV